MKIGVDKRKDRAVYMQIVDQLRLEFVSGRVRPGERLPGMRELAQHLGVRRPVVEKAFHELEEKGWIEVRARSGAFVTRAGTRMLKRERVRRVLRLVDGVLREGRALGFSDDEILDIFRFRVEK